MRFLLFHLLRLKRMPIVWTDSGGYGLTENVIVVGKERMAAVSHYWVVHLGRRKWRVSPRFAASDAFLREHLTHKQDVQCVS